jgi:hypothetical protein
MNNGPVAPSEQTLTWYRSHMDDPSGALLRRLCDPDRWTRNAAFFELLLHVMLKKADFTVTHEPEIQDSPRRPDFLVRSPDGLHFYIEATLVTSIASTYPNDPRLADGRRHSAFFDSSLGQIGRVDPVLHALASPGEQSPIQSRPGHDKINKISRKILRKSRHYASLDAPLIIAIGIPNYDPSVVSLIDACLTETMEAAFVNDSSLVEAGKRLRLVLKSTSGGNVSGVLVLCNVASHCIHGCRISWHPNPWTQYPLLSSFELPAGGGVLTHGARST